ncbi:MAG: PAS domain-containing protein [Desulfobacula sp.]|nr:PAS domain-containing protein [Desulfobacula sp.]
MKLPEKEIEAILSGIKDFVLIISPEREILETNAAFLKHIGCAREDVIGRKCFEVLKEDNRKPSNCHNICPLEEVIKNKRRCQIELTRLDSDNKPRYTELTIFPIWEKKGKIAKFVEISRDITQRKIDEKQDKDYLVKMVEDRTRQLKETHERLLHQDKMASLGKLSSSVVHEINNPVAGILNLVMLSKRILKEDEIKQDELDLFDQYLGLMETEIRRIGRIVSNLLVFARQSKIEVVKFDVNELIEQTLILNSNLLKINKIRVIEELEHNLPLISASEDQLKQVIMNLLSNAVESMITVSTKRLTIRTFSKPEKKAVVIQVKDTGTGISQETISKIFEPFFTTKKNGKGVGLGLSVVYGIIKEHGGLLYVDSTPGKGTRFSITLFQELDSNRESSPLSPSTENKAGKAGQKTG